MRNNSFISRYELWFIIGTAILYVGRRLFIEVERIDGLIGLTATGNGIPAGAFRRYLGGYDHTLNNNVPLIAGMCLFLMAWYVFHTLAYPKLQEKPDDQTGWLLAGVTFLLLLAATLVYHYLKLYVRYQYNPAGNIIGLSVDSLYRRRTVLADAIGLGIMLGVYELAFQYYQFLANRIRLESTRYFRLISYIFLGVIGLLTINIALTSIPPTLWRGNLRDALLILGIVLQIMCFQEYIYRFILPLLKAPRTSETILYKSVGLCLLLAFVATTVLWGASTGFYYGSYIRGPMAPFLFMVLTGSVSIAYGRQVLNREKTVLQTQVSTGAAELASLRAQINPHFLFNALNSLYATALKENSEKTADGIQKLGDMMRFMLQENNRDRIPLDKEIEYLRNYIDMQRLRIDEKHNINIRVTIQEPDQALYIAPMLLTPFVENAFKYGISLRNASWIHITLTLDDTRLYFKVHNSRHPKSTDTAMTEPESAQSGVGLDNVRKRLELIYPGRYQLDIQQSDQDYFVSLSLIYQGEFKLEIPLVRG